MNCKKCGNIINEGEKFCRNCGEPVNNLETVSNQPIYNEQSTNLNQNNINYQTSNINQNNINYQTSNVNGYTQQPVQNPINNYNQPIQNQLNNEPKNNGSDKKNLLILIGIVAILVVAFVVGYLLINKDKGNDKSNNKSTTNEYEETINNTVDNSDDKDDWDTDDSTSTDTTETSTTYTYKNFKFNKISGYDYETTSNGLQITDYNNVIAIEVTPGSFDIVKNNTDTINSTFENQGYEIKNTTVKTYGGVEYITSEVSKDGISMLILYTKANSSYTFVIGVSNIKYTIDYNSINIVNKIIKGATYIG
jgi:hypothetical protein